MGFPNMITPRLPQPGEVYCRRDELNEGRMWRVVSVGRELVYLQGVERRGFIRVRIMRLAQWYKRVPEAE